MRRCPTRLAALAAVLCLAVRPAPVRAGGTTSAAPSGLPTYRLTTKMGLPSPGPDFKHINPAAALPQVEALVLPGTIAPPTLPGGKQGSPLTVLPDSYGFDPSKLAVFLQDPKDAGQTVLPFDQKLGMAFFGSGLAPGAQLHFALNTGKVLTTPPALVSATPGVTISLETLATPAPATSSSAVTPSSVVPVPEPMPPALWSALAGLILFRTWSGRRGADAPADCSPSSITL